MLDDGTTVYCLTCEYTIEFYFAEKWAEVVGQVLYYALKTDKKPEVVLIMEKQAKDKNYLIRLRVLAQKYNFQI